MIKPFLFLSAQFLTSLFGDSNEKPNIIYLICDDLGYGDIQCLNEKAGKIPTPHTNKLASEGMTFTDSHSGSSVCTPTRYGLLTGRYSWRTHLQKGVVTGFAPCLIEKNRPTVASFLKAHGYHTAIIGKWHLNFQYLNPESGSQYKRDKYKSPPVASLIPDGPVHRGFDYFHGFHHARNMEAVIVNDKVIAHDPPINMLPRLTRESVNYIMSRKGMENPFFLYVPLGSPHTPILPTREWEGRSGLGKYGDFVMQTDHVVGQIQEALHEIAEDQNTLFIFTSDNGCSKAAGIAELEKQGHKVSAELRGSKADLWEGGHRVPFIVKWPGKVLPGSLSDQIICHTDLFATVSEILGSPLPEKGAEDSVSFLPALLGKKIQSSRKGIVHHSISGHFAYRYGKWKLLLARASGGWTFPRENEAPINFPEAQLYDMSSDSGELTNLYRKEPLVVKNLLRHLENDINRGRSTRGRKAENDVSEIVLWKSERKIK